MGLKKLVNTVKPPCYKCPYMLGQIVFVTDPCCQCKTNNYDTYYRLIGGQQKRTKELSTNNFN